MVFLSEASIRQMVQEALGGGGYPTLDGDGNFPIVPSPLAEPIVTKLALQPVRVMRVPTDRNEFELAVSELVDGVEDDYLPTLFLKLRELVSDFVPPELEHSPCPTDCSPKDDQMPNNLPPDDQMTALRAEVRRLIKTMISEAETEDEDPLAQWRPGGARYRPKTYRGPIGISGGPPITRDDPTDGDDWDSDLSDDWDDAGSAETDPASDPYPEEYLKNPGYPAIGDEEEAWEDLEAAIARSAWEPEPTQTKYQARNAELDSFRGRDRDADWDEATLGEPEVAGAGKKKDTISKVSMTLDDIAKDKEFEGMSVGALHGMIAKAARKLGYVVQELGEGELENVLNDSTDKFINFLIKQGAQKDENGKPLLSMSDVMDLRGATRFDNDEDGRRVRKDLDPESENMRKAIQELPLFREYLSAVIEEMMEEDGFAVSHKDAAKDKDKHSVIHRMKTTTR
jgi:hypothetical protein